MKTKIDNSWFPTSMEHSPKDLSNAAFKKKLTHDLESNINWWNSLNFAEKIPYKVFKTGEAIKKMDEIKNNLKKSNLTDAKKGMSELYSAVKGHCEADVDSFCQDLCK